jgi:acetyltransferase-like isoleucine patch superfamily enzyme
MKSIKKYIKKILPKNTVLYLEKYFGQRNALKSVKDSLSIFGGKVELYDKFEFEKPVSIYGSVNFGNCFVGKFTYFSGDSNISRSKIGRYCSIAKGVKIGLIPHPTSKFVSVSPLFYTTGGQNYADKKYFEESLTTEIGNDVWVCENALIKAGVKIGDGAIIGAGAVVTKNVEPYAIVVGVPAQIKRYRFTEDQIKFLVAFKWWDKPDEWVKENWKDFHDIEKFIEKYGKTGKI